MSSRRTLASVDLLRRSGKNATRSRTCRSLSIPKKTKLYVEQTQLLPEAWSEYMSAEHDDKGRFETNCLPALVLLTGFEMHLVLEQRLQAQAVPSGKTQKVLKDVIHALLDFALGAEGSLFRTCQWNFSHFDDQSSGSDITSLQTLKQVMTRLANTSIMRLNESSMGKLFDIAVMGAKRHAFYAESSAWICEVIHEQLDWMGDVISPRPPQINTLKARLSQFYQDQYEGSPLHRVRE